MSIGVRNCRVGALFVVAMLALGLVPCQSASASPGAAGLEGGAGSADHCVIVLDKLRPGEQESRIVSRKCAPRVQDLHIQSETLLMTWYQDAGYGGKSTTLIGYGGPCDTAGYGFRDTGAGDSWWRDNISSFMVWNNCLNVRGHELLNYGGKWAYWKYNQRYVGDYLNDRIRSIEIWASY